jgi:TolB-like protein
MLKRLLEVVQSRKVDRLAAAYAVCGWLLVQAASIALPAFEAPGWVLKALIVFLVLGFPVAIAAGWMSAPHLSVDPKPLRAGRAVALVAVLLVAILSVGEFAYWVSRHEHGVPAADAATNTMPSAASIAVLPFVNMSGNPAKDYFSDGISEELLNDLANLPQLRVAARTSSFAFKGKNENATTIARRLGVRSVLEGSVREEGTHLRIHAELINGADGYDLWSASFDRDLTDALAVQDEIARAIVAALTHKLLPPGKVLPNRPTTIDPEAYRDYLAAQFALGPRTEAGSQKAVEFFQKAVARQPDFADAYAGLARASMNVSDYQSSSKGLIASANAALARALALDPNNLDALGVHLDLALHRMDWRTAIADAARMQRINPHSQAVLHEMFRFYQALGFPEEALAAAQGAAQLNRLSFVDLLNVATAFNHLNRFAEAAKVGEDALALEPNQPDILAYLCTAYAHGNQTAKANAIEAQLVTMRQNENVEGCRFDLAVTGGRTAEAIATIGRLAAQFPHGDLYAVDIADSYAVAGDYDQSIKWLNKSYDLREFVIFTITTDKAIPSEYYNTAGWKEFWQRPLTLEWRSAHDQVAAELVAAHPPS